MKQHRYERIAQALEQRIASGDVAVGDSLPTEADLCRKYRVSRYTAREALRRLRDAGLITRRPRAGSTVAATRADSTFNLPLGSAEDLLRYATETRFLIQQRRYIRAAGADLAALECRRGQQWIKLSGLRVRPGLATPVCLLDVYLNIALAGLEKRLPRSSGVIYPQVEKALGVRIAWIGHRIEGTLLGGEAAERLRAKAGAPGLRVRRYYYDANERLLELSDSLHAAERFAYEMRLSRP
ncbi:MAG TPA: GntR family transcriptional regulator [Burkholderiales bacterium]|nr:GntR family transcriptional regulator [Burkholderiales bacterium]